MRNLVPIKAATLLTLSCWFCGAFAGESTNSDKETDAANNWRNYTEGLLELGEYGRSLLSDPDDPQLQQELYRHLHLILSQTYGALVYQSEDYPDFFPAFSSLYNFAIDNFDDSYYVTPLDAQGVYRISGYRGSSYIVDMQIGEDDFFSKGLGPVLAPIQQYDLDKEINFGENGEFELVLSAERPQGYQGNWLELGATAKYLCIRQIYYNWVEESEQPGRFAIERLDLPAIKPRESAEQISAQLKDIVISTTNWLNFGFSISKSLKERGVVNRLENSHFASDAGGVASQLYTNGLFDLQDDEALLIEIDIPENCRYWSLVVYDEFWRVTGDWMHRQSSINGPSAHIDNDGKMRAVVSAQDPGITNWLDNAGYQHGGIFGRFKDCPGNPQSHSKKIKVTDLRLHLPRNTPSVTAEQRDATLRARRRALQLRNRW